MAREKWEVEWCTDGKDGDADSCTENVREFATEAEAVAFAKTVVEADYWGAPRVSLMRARVFDPGDGGPRMREWEYVRGVDVVT